MKIAEILTRPVEVTVCRRPVSSCIRISAEIMMMTMNLHQGLFCSLKPYFLATFYAKNPDSMHIQPVPLKLLSVVLIKDLLGQF